MSYLPLINPDAKTEDDILQEELDKVSLKTIEGELTQSQLANQLRSINPRWQDPNISDDIVLADAISRNPALKSALEDRPRGFVEQAPYYARELINTFKYGMPEVASDIVQAIPDGPFLDDEGWKEWAGDSYKDFKEWQENERKNNPEYAAWERWNSTNQGIHSIGDVFSGDLMAKVASNWITTGAIMGTSTTAGLVTLAGTRNPSAAGTVAVTTGALLGGLFEGSDEAMASLDYLTEDRPIDRRVFNNTLKEFQESLDPSITNEKRKALIDNWIEGNYIFNPNGTIIEKGLSVEEAQDANTGAVLTYALAGGLLESLPYARMMRYVPGLSGAYKKMIHGSFLHKYASAVKRKPYSPKFLNRLFNVDAWKGITGDIAAESITESAQYLAQVAAETAPFIGYKDEFMEGFDSGVLKESAIIGGLSGGALSLSAHGTFNASGLSENLSNFAARKFYADKSRIFAKKQEDGTWGLALRYKDTVTDLTANELGENVQFNFDKKKYALEAAADLEIDVQNQWNAEELRKNYGKVEAAVDVEKTDDGKFRVFVTNKDGKVVDEVVLDTLSYANKIKKKMETSVNRLNTIYNDPAQKEVRTELEQEGSNVEVPINIEGTDTIDSEVVAIKGAFGRVANMSEEELDIHQNNEENLSEQTYENPNFIKKIIEKRGKEVLDKAGITPEEVLENIESWVESDMDEDANFTQDILEDFQSILDFDETITEEVTEQEDIDFTQEQLEAFDKEETQEDAPELISGLTFRPSEATDQELASELERLQAIDSPSKIDQVQIESIQEEQKSRKDILQEELQKEDEQADTFYPSKESIYADKLNKVQEDIQIAQKEVDSIPKNEFRDKEGNLTDKAQIATDKLDSLKRQERELKSLIDEEGLKEQELAAKTKDEGPAEEGVHPAILAERKRLHDKMVAGLPKRSREDLKGMLQARGKITNEEINKMSKEQMIDVLSKEEPSVLPEEAFEDKEKLDKLIKKYEKKEAPKKQTKSTEQVIKERKLKRIVRTLTNKITFADGSKIKIKLDSKLESAGEYDPNTKTITLNPDKAGMDTPFHEISHPLIDEIYANNSDLFNNLYDQVVKSSYGKDIIKTVKGRGYEPDSDLFKIEVIAESIGRVASGKYRSYSNPIVKVVNRFVNWVREKLFGVAWASRITSNDLSLDTTIEELSDIITKEGYQIKLGDTPKDLNEYRENIINLVKYQIAQARGVDAAKNKLFRTALTTYTKMVKRIGGRKAIPDPLLFQKQMLDLMPIDMHKDFNEWFHKEFKGSKLLKDRVKGEKRDSNFYWLEDTKYEDIVTDLYDSIRDGLDNLSQSNLDTSHQSVSINERVFLAIFNTTITHPQYAQMAKFARGEYVEGWNELDSDGKPILVDSFLSFANVVVNKLKLGDVTKYDLMAEYQKDFLVQEYNKFNSSIPTNSNTGNNFRDHYILRMDLSGANVTGPVVDRFELKKDKDPLTDTSNSQWEKINLLEVLGGAGLFNVLSEGDFKTKRKIGETIEDGVQENIYGYLSRGSFLTTDEFQALRGVLDQHNLALISTRGDKPQVYFASITDSHREIAKTKKSILDYWVSQKKYVGKKDVENYTKNEDGNWLSQKEIAANIAVHEALKGVWPKYASEKLTTTLKRLPIPTSSISYSKEMPNYKLARLNPMEDNLSWVYTEGEETFETKMRNNSMPGVKSKYIGDGATLTSRDMFKKFKTFFGFSSDSHKAKTFIYNKQGDDVLMMKHQQFAVDPGVKIYKNYGKAGEKLLVEVDNKGNIIYYGKDKNGEYVDMLSTSDEIKISNGELAEDVVEMPGKTIGVSKIENTIAKNAKHGMQWYNHIFDPEVINAFREHILPEIEDNYEKLYNNFKGDMSPKMIEDFLAYLEKNDNEGYLPTILELAKLGAGRHQSLEPILNSLMMNKLAIPAIQSSYQEGSRYDMSPNFRGDLKENEVSLATQNSTMIWQAYANAMGKPLSDFDRKKDIHEINAWLKDNEVNVFITRFPVPHAGGVILARVKRLHTKKSLIELNATDTFAKLEGDYDGDHVQVELLPKGMEAPFKKAFEKINKEVKGIDLNRYVNNSFQGGKMSSIADRIRIMDALSQGKKAIGEITNIQSIYGQLQDALESVTIYNTDSYENTTFTLRKPNETFRWYVSYIDSKGKKKHYVDIKVKDYLRIILQAAVDNSEFMLLGQWNYSQMKMFANLFKDKNGKSATEFDVIKMKPLIDMHKKPGLIRRGQGVTQDGQFSKINLSDQIEESRAYTEYIKDRKRYLLNLEQGRDGGIVDISFKPSSISPIERVALVPYKMYKEYLMLNEKDGFVQSEDGSPIKILSVVHANAHKESLDRLVNEYDKLFESAWNKDKTELLDKNEFIKSEAEKGRSYGEDMTSDFFSRIKKYKTMSLSTMDRNDTFIEFKEKWDPQYKELSEVAKVAATFVFLKQYSQQVYAGRAGFPAASRSKKEYQTLHEKVLEKYFKYYNEALTNKDKATNQNLFREKHKWGTNTTLNEIVKRVCR